MRGRVLHAAALGMVVAAVAAVSLADAALGSNASARRAAQLEATRALDALALPPGAAQAATDPSGGALAVVALRPLTPRLVQRHAFWRVPGSPQATLSWIRQHLPAGARITARGEQSRPQGPTVTLLQLSFRHVPAGVMASSLVVAATAARSGATALRVDAEAVWRLARPAWAHVPAGVRALTVVERRPDRPTASTVTVTAPARVRRIVQLVNRFPVSQRDAGAMVICPLDVGPMAKVSFFRHRGDTKPVAVANADGSGCGTLSLQIGRRTAPALTGGPRLIAALGIR